MSYGRRQLEYQRPPAACYGPGLRVLVALAIGCFCMDLPSTWAAATVPTRVPDRRADWGTPALDAFDLPRAALVAAGVTDPDIQARVQRKLSRFCQIDATVPPRGDDGSSRARAAYLFRKMHRELLTGRYQSQCFRLDRSVDGGPYNCVTSTILFISICRRAGVRATAVARSHHVYCRILDPHPFDVQTTCPRWFEQMPSIGSVADDADAGRSVERVRLIDDIQLLGKVRYNRGVVLLRDARFGPAVRQLQQACQLDPDDGPARQNLIAAWNNWSLQLCDADCFRQAAAKILAGLRLEPNNTALLANDLHVHQQWTLELCARHRFADAVALLERCHQRRPEVELFDRGRWFVFGQWAQFLASQGRSRDAVAILSTACAEHPHAHELADYLTGLMAGRRGQSDGA